MSCLKSICLAPRKINIKIFKCERGRATGSFPSLNVSCDICMKVGEGDTKINNYINSLMI